MHHLASSAGASAQASFSWTTKRAFTAPAASCAAATFFICERRPINVIFQNIKVDINVQ
jgi:hypothetical protein